MNLTTFTSRAAASVVAAVAGIISYGHIRSVALAAGESESAAMLLPLGIDGLIAVAALAFLEDKRAGRRPRLSARGALAFGIVATIAGNVASAEPSWAARAVAAVPAVSFLVAVEVLSRTGRPHRESLRTQTSTAETQRSLDTGRPGRRRSTGKRSAAEKVAAARAKAPDATQQEIRKRTGLGLRTVARHWKAIEPESPEPGPNNREHGDVPELAEVAP